MSSVSSRRNAGTALLSPAPGSLQPAAEARDWSALPRDIVLDIFLRLGPREVMLGAEFACKPWRCVALEEPSLWRRVGMENPNDDTHRRRIDGRVESAMKFVALDRAAGQCEAFKGYCDDDYLRRLVKRAPTLKCLHISEHESDYQDGEDLVEALMKLPFLEELEVYFKYYIIEDKDENILRAICQSCPHLKRLVLRFLSAFDIAVDEDEHMRKTIDGKISLMPKLHTLEMYDCDLKIKGLKGILDNCPALKTLHVDGYFDKGEMDKKLRMKCARVKNLTLPNRISPHIY